MASQDWVDKDFYKILGVSKDASDVDIKKAYRKLARKHHPDQNQGDAGSERMFKDVSEAYSVLSDPEERQQYYAIRAMGGGARFSAGGAGGGAGKAMGVFAEECVAKYNFTREQMDQFAIDSTKRFGSEHGHTYVNGVLDKAALVLRGTEAQASRTR